VATEYITKKVPKEADVILKYVQAHYQLEKGEKATEGETIEMALEHVAEEKYGYLKGKKAKYTWKDIEGSIKGGKKSHPEEIDKVVYNL